MIVISRAGSSGDVAERATVLSSAPGMRGIAREPLVLIGNAWGDFESPGSTPRHLRLQHTNGRADRLQDLPGFVTHRR